MTNTVTNAKTVAERVAAGAAHLDNTHPGWATRIDAEEIIGWHPWHSVLGQLDEAGTTVDLTPAERIAYGHWATADAGPVDSEEDNDERLREYDQLTAAWREQVATRTAQAREEIAAQVRAELARHDARGVELRTTLELHDSVRRGMVAMLADLEQDASQPAPTTHTVELPGGHLLQVVTRDQHDAQCRWRVATPQDTNPVVAHCAGCGLSYPAKDGGAR